MEEKDLGKLIEQYRHTGDQQIQRRSSAGKSRDRFPFIIGKYQTAFYFRLRPFAQYVSVLFSAGFKRRSVTGRKSTDGNVHLSPVFLYDIV